MPAIAEIVDPPVFRMNPSARSKRHPAPPTTETREALLAGARAAFQVWEHAAERSRQADANGNADRAQLAQAALAARYQLDKALGFPISGKRRREAVASGWESAAPAEEGDR
ncbi:hypothetical protein [Planomonospora sp. ID82291]|uniref:hypothetical protein n=1 Tax=Planomonospora sp. ID82291 TaxID=2738136 RepID=UPI0018C3E9EB|nr:hypothetical protein [Planomonospora sp. ID82291]MBG0818752.1 hypothetical protein [Planomonospora sp. ID82291]